MNRPLLAAAALLAVAPMIAHASDVKNVTVDPAVIRPGQEFSLVIQPADGVPAACGLQVSMGDGRSMDLRLEPNQTLIAKHTYNAAGTFRVEMAGKLMIRGLRSTLPCDVRFEPLALAVGTGRSAIAGLPAAQTNAPAPAPAARAPSSTTAAQDLADSNVLVLLNPKAAGVRVTKSLDGSARVSLDTRGQRVVVAAQQLYEYRTRQGVINREAHYSGLSPDMMPRIHREVQNILQSHGIAANNVDINRDASLLSSGDRSRPVLSSRDVLALHPRMDMRLLQPLLDRGELMVLGEVDVSTLIDRTRSDRDRREAAARRDAERTDATLASFSRNRDKYTAFIFGWTPPVDQNPRAPAASPQVCMLAVSGDAAAPYLGFRNLEDFSYAAGVARSTRYDLTVRDLEELFQAIQLGKCHRAVVSVPNAEKLAPALKRDNISFTLTSLKTAGELRASFAEGARINR